MNTESISGEGLILTAGGVDAHIHFICPQLADVAIASGKFHSCLGLLKSLCIVNCFSSLGSWLLYGY